MPYRVLVPLPCVNYLVPDMYFTSSVGAVHTRQYIFGSTGTGFYLEQFQNLSLQKLSQGS